MWQVVKSESGAVEKTVKSHSKAVLSVVSGATFTATTSEDFEIHLYDTAALMKSCDGSVVQRLWQKYGWIFHFVQKLVNLAYFHSTCANLTIWSCHLLRQPLFYCKTFVFTLWNILFSFLALGVCSTKLWMGEIKCHVLVSRVPQERCGAKLRGVDWPQWSCDMLCSQCCWDEACIGQPRYGLLLVAYFVNFHSFVHLLIH